MAVAIAWLPGPAGTRRRVAKLSVEEPDAAEPARPDLWGAKVSNDPGLPRPPATPPTRRGALLRGAASNEPKGRGGARGGGVGRVGPLAGWHRLRLLRQIGDQLVPGVEQLLLVEDVVAVEDGAALVPGQEHGDALGDVRADQVAGGGAATVVEEAGRHPGRLAGRAPRRAPSADGDAVAVEDERAVGVAACPPPRQGLGDGRRDGEDASHQSLRARGREPDDTAGPIDLVPGEAEDLLLAPAGVVGEIEDVLPRGGQVGADGEVFGVLEEALAGGDSRGGGRGSRARCRASPSGRRACPCGGGPRSPG